MKLTKKEVLTALYHLDAMISWYCDNVDCNYCCYKLKNETECKRDKYLDMLKQFTNEHFNNTALRFQELQIGIPYYDKKEEVWCVFTTLNKEQMTGTIIHIVDKFLVYNTFKFEENRFYRKEVKDHE